VGVAVRAQAFADLFRESWRSQEGGLTNAGYHGALFSQLPSAAIRDAALVSHNGEILSKQEYPSVGKAWSKRAVVMDTYLAGLEAEMVLQPELRYLLVGELMHTYIPEYGIPVLRKLLRYPANIVLQASDWMYAQKPMSFPDRFRILLGNPSALVYGPVLLSEAKKFHRTVDTFYGAGTMVKIREMPDPEWATELLHGYAELAGISPSDM
jgi:hypothetical protein